MRFQKIIGLSCVLLGCMINANSLANYASESTDAIGRRQMQKLDIKNRPSFASNPASALSNNAGSVGVSNAGGSAYTQSNKRSSEQEPYPIVQPGSQAAGGKRLDNFKDGDSGAISNPGNSGSSAGIYR